MSKEFFLLLREVLVDRISGDPSLCVLPSSKEPCTVCNMLFTSSSCLSSWSISDMVDMLDLGRLEALKGDPCWPSAIDLGRLTPPWCPEGDWAGEAGVRTGDSAWEGLPEPREERVVGRR